MHILTQTAVLTLLLAASAQAQTVRMEDPHVHGHGTVSVAVDGPVLTVMVETPAHDVLGFEHVASTAADKRLVAAVRSLLESPRTLFEVSSDTTCALEGADIAIGPERAATGGDSGHSDIAATYTFRCAAPPDLDQIAFPWFEAFPLSEKLDMIVLDRRGQHAGSVTPAQPVFHIPQS